MTEQVTSVDLTVNGREVSMEVPVRRLLSDFLRHDLRLTGTHVGCEHGVCGACTVVMDGRAVRSCLMLAATAHGAEITTVEGLAGPDGSLHPVQQAFIDAHGLQCGFCTPGFLTSLASVIDEGRTDDADLDEAVGGNLCRCTGYQNIKEAARRARDLAGTNEESPRG